MERKPYPLSEAEREKWMSKLVPEIHKSIVNHPRTVATCSALTQRVQDQLLAISGVMLVYLKISLETELERAATREANGEHWFHDEFLIRDQFLTMRLPSPEERIIVLPAEGSPDELVGRALNLVRWTDFCSRTRAP